MARLRHGPSHLLVIGVTEARRPSDIRKGGRIDFFAGFPNSPLISALRLPTVNGGETVARPTPRPTRDLAFSPAEPTAGAAVEGEAGCASGFPVRLSRSATPFTTWAS